MEKILNFLFIFLIVFCTQVFAKTESKNEEVFNNFYSDSLIIDGQIEEETNEIQIKANRQGKKKLDYANLFSKPKVEWHNISTKKSGFFVGLSGVFAMPLSSDNNAPIEFQAIYPYGIGYGLKVGLAYFSNPFIGFRIYTEYNEYSSSQKFQSADNKDRSYKMDYLIGGINVLFDTNFGRNYNHLVGVIVDMAYAAYMNFHSNWTSVENGQILKGKDSFESGNRFSLGVGLRYVFANKHQFEIIARRFSNVRNANENPIANKSQVIFTQISSVTIGYVYVF